MWLRSGYIIRSFRLSSCEFHRLIVNIFTTKLTKVRIKFDLDPISDSNRNPQRPKKKEKKMV
jgi:hypothetical protein